MRNNKIKVELDFENERWRIKTDEITLPVFLVEEMYNRIFEDMLETAYQIAMKKLLKKGVSYDSRFNN